MIFRFNFLKSIIFFLLVIFMSGFVLGATNDVFLVMSDGSEKLCTESDPCVVNELGTYTIKSVSVRNCNLGWVSVSDYKVYFNPVDSVTTEVSFPPVSQDTIINLNFLRGSGCPFDGNGFFKVVDYIGPVHEGFQIDFTKGTADTAHRLIAHDYIMPFYDFKKKDGFDVSVEFGNLISFINLFVGVSGSGSLSAGTISNPYFKVSSLNGVDEAFIEPDAEIKDSIDIQNADLQTAQITSTLEAGVIINDDLNIDGKLSNSIRNIVFSDDVSVGTGSFVVHGLSNLDDVVEVSNYKYYLSSTIYGFQPSHHRCVCDTNSDVKDCLNSDFDSETNDLCYDEYDDASVPAYDIYVRDNAAINIDSSIVGNMISFENDRGIVLGGVFRSTWPAPDYLGIDNLVLDSGFESRFFDVWKKTGKVDFSTIIVHSGSSSLKINSDSFVESEKIPIPVLDHDLSLTFSGWYYVDKPNEKDGNVLIKFYDGETIGGSSSLFLDDKTNSWNRFFKTITIPSNYNFDSFSIVLKAFDGETVYFDDLQLESDTELTKFKPRMLNFLGGAEFGGLISILYARGFVNILDSLIILGGLEVDDLTVQNILKVTNLNLESDLNVHNDIYAESFSGSLNLRKACDGMSNKVRSDNGFALSFASGNPCSAGDLCTLDSDCGSGMRCSVKGYCVEGNCNDGIDNDGDGLIDYNDPDCACPDGSTLYNLGCFKCTPSKTLVDEGESLTYTLSLEAGVPGLSVINFNNGESNSNHGFYNPLTISTFYNSYGTYNAYFTDTETGSRIITCPTVTVSCVPQCDGVCNVPDGCGGVCTCPIGVCDNSNKVCVDCLEDSNCDSGEFCHNNVCIECLADRDCGLGNVCLDDNTCCTPQTCSDLGYDCGTLSSSERGCGLPDFDCGICSQGYCVDNKCELPGECGCKLGEPSVNNCVIGYTPRCIGEVDCECVPPLN